MAQLPPPPTNAPEGSYAWIDWYRQLRDFLVGSGGAIAWNSVSKSGANITDIPTRLHNSLQSIQGGSSGNFYHLTRSIEVDSVIDFPNIAANSSNTQTVTVTGANVQDVVALGLPTTAAAGIIFNAFVSAADTVSIRAFNVTAGAIDPASATYRVLVLKA